MVQLLLNRRGTLRVKGKDYLLELETHGKEGQKERNRMVHQLFFCKIKSTSFLLTKSLTISNFGHPVSKSWLRPYSEECSEP